MPSDLNNTSPFPQNVQFPLTWEDGQVDYWQFSFDFEFESSALENIEFVKFDLLTRLTDAVMVDESELF